MAMCTQMCSKSHDEKISLVNMCSRLKMAMHYLNICCQTISLQIFLNLIWYYSRLWTSNYVSLETKFVLLNARELQSLAWAKSEIGCSNQLVHQGALSKREIAFVNQNLLFWSFKNNQLCNFTPSSDLKLSRQRTFSFR